MTTQTATAGTEATAEAVLNGTAKAPRFFSTVDSMKIELEVIAENKLQTIAGIVLHTTKLALGLGGIVLAVGGVVALVARNSAEVVAAVTEGA